MSIWHCKEDFEKKISENMFIEWAQVHSNYYGTSREFIDQGLQVGKKMLFDLDVQGADAIKNLYGRDGKVIFIEPPSVAELERRLRTRGTDKEEVILERIANAKSELLRKHHYDYLVMNDDVNRAYKELKSIIEEILR